MFDLLIKNGRVVDGTGAPWFRADVGVQDGKISAIGRFPDGNAREVIDAENQIVAPGFIDIHCHADFTILIDPRASTALRQGVTTQVVGNCGSSAAPLGGEMDRSRGIFGGSQVPAEIPTWTRVGEFLNILQDRRPAINVGTLVGHSTLRIITMGYQMRAATRDEIASMRRLVAEAMDDGALGISTGLEYFPGNCSETEEVIALVSEAAAHHGFYATHVRQRDYHAIAAHKEAIRIAEEAGAQLQVSHMPPRVWANRGDYRRMVALLEEARARGLDAAFDTVVYPWGATNIAAMLPNWVLKDGTRKALELLREPAARERIKEYRFPMYKFVASNQWDQVWLYYSDKNPQYNGLTFEAIGADRRQDPYDAILDVIAEEGDGFASMAWGGAAYDADEFRAAFCHPLCCPMSDGLTLAQDGPLAEMRHPFAYGWAAHVLGTYQREEHLLPLEETIRKLTSFPASRAGLKGRGLIREGVTADVAIFNPLMVRDNVTLGNLNVYPEGFSWVLVNGQVALRNGQETGCGAGQVLRR